MEKNDTPAYSPYPLSAHPPELVLHPSPNLFAPVMWSQQWMLPNPMMAPPHMYPPHFQYPSQPWQLQQYAVTASHPSVAAAPHVGVPAWVPPEGRNQRPVGFLNGELVYELAPPFNNVASAPPPPSNTHKKRKLGADEEEEPYIKKPPNAFMIFVKEQRPSAVAHCNVSDSAVVNRILGQHWAALTPQQRAPYFEKAKAVRSLHEQQHPQWSSRDSYGKKRNSQRCKAAHSFIIPAAASVSGPNKVTQLPEEGPASLRQPAAMVDPSLCSPPNSEADSAPLIRPEEATEKHTEFLHNEEEFLLEEALLHSLVTQSAQSPTEEEEELLRNLELLLDSSEPDLHSHTYS